jgi:hypothetical protein
MVEVALARPHSMNSVLVDQIVVPHWLSVLTSTVKIFVLNGATPSASARAMNFLRAWSSRQWCRRHRSNNEQVAAVAAARQRGGG